jgi:hypothetical protein
MRLKVHFVVPAGEGTSALEAKDMIKALFDLRRLSLWRATATWELIDDDGRLVADQSTNAPSAEQGTCDLCGQELLRDPANGDVWHPHTVAKACPPEPSLTDPEAWQQFIRAGLRSGRPGREHFVARS